MRLEHLNGARDAVCETTLALDRQRADDFVEARRGAVFDKVHYAFLLRLRRAQAISAGVSCHFDDTPLVVSANVRTNVVQQTRNQRNSGHDNSRDIYAPVWTSY